MALNHTHDKLSKNRKSNTNGGAAKKETEKDNKNNGGKVESEQKDDSDLLEGRTLVEVEALLIMSTTRMKIKGEARSEVYYLHRLRDLKLQWLSYKTSGTRISSK